MHFFRTIWRKCALFQVFAFGLALAGCGSDDHGTSLLSLARIPAQSQPDFSNLAVHKSSARYSDALLKCVKADAIEDSCTLETLPLLRQETEGAVPTVDQIMDRVVVSHPWMGDRFRQVVEDLDTDIRTLLKGVTAIVIDDDISRAFYYPLTAAIYIDPAYLWRTQAEKATISRGSGGSGGAYPLLFAPMWRYTRNNDYASRDEDSFGAQGRTLDDIRYEAAAVLYHELAHANDFFPPGSTVDPKLSAAQNALNLGVQGARVHQQLLDKYPWDAELWPGLGPVIYRDGAPTAAQRAITAAQAGADFAIDGTNDGYAYSIEPEDVSMLFEETMMKIHYGLARDVAFVSVPTTTDYDCTDLVVGWGNRNRIGNPVVKERAKFVVSKLLPGSGREDDISLFPAPTPLQTGNDWCANLDPTETSASLLSVRDYSRQLQRDLRPPHER